MKPCISAAVLLAVLAVFPVQARGQAVVTRGGAVRNTVTAQFRADADPQDDKERFIVLAPTGPVIVEAHLTVDGKPFRLLREHLVDELLAAADPDGDGQAAWTQALQSSRFQILGYRGQNAQQREALVKQFDRNRNQVVDREEVRRYVAQVGVSAFGLIAYLNRYGQADLRELLDTDGDHELSPDELAAAAGRLKSRDANDDDILDMLELRGSAYGNQRGRQLGPDGRVASVHLLGPAADLVGVYEAMKQRYAKDDEITAESLPAAAELVEQLDLNENGRVDAGEAIGLHVVKPHAVVSVKLFTRPDAAPQVSVQSTSSGLTQAGEAEAGPSDGVTLSGYGAELRLLGSRSLPAANYKASAQALLSRYDGDKNGYLQVQELKEQQNAQYLVQQFEAWDADGDGKVFAAEIEADYDRRQAPLMTRVTAIGADRGVSLFSAVDVSGDNRLGLRETRTAEEKLRRFDDNHDGRISVEELPTSINVAFGVGRAAYSGYAGVGGVGGQRPGGAAAAEQGPKWFVHMDTNGDGDVSRREFLGPAGAFDQLDADSDGLLSRNEAEKAR